MPGPARKMSQELRLSFRDQLRAARAKAREDSEDFIQLVRVFERLGEAMLQPGERAGNGLGDYREKIADIWEPDSAPNEFYHLFKLVKNGRNEAVHGGHVARNLVRHATHLSLLLEEELVDDMDQVQNFMAENPICAYTWQPISHVRHLMLENAFSFLPLQKEEQGPWFFLSDDALVSYLRGDGNERERRIRINQTVGDALSALRDLVVEAWVVSKTTPIQDLVARRAEHIGRPALVTEKGAQSGRLLGIVTAEDLL